MQEHSKQQTNNMNDKNNNTDIPLQHRAPAEEDPTTLLPHYHLGGTTYFGYRMVLASRLFDRRITSILKEHGPLSLPEWRVISQLGLAPKGTVRSLARGAAVDRAEVSRVLRKLEQQHYVFREENSTDQRSPHFSLTDEGEALLQRLREPISRFIAGLMREFSEEEIAIADKVLWAVAKGSAI